MAATFQETIVDEAGNVLAGVAVEVRQTVAVGADPSTGALVDIFSDEALATPKANPGVTDSDAHFDFFAANSQLMVNVIVGTGVSQRILLNRVIAVPQAQPYATRALAVTAWAARPASVKRISWIHGQVPSQGVTTLSIVESTGATAVPGFVDGLPDGKEYVNHYGQNTTPGTTDMSAAFTALVARMNVAGIDGYLLGENYLCDAGVIDLTYPGAWIMGQGKGNVANLSPSEPLCSVITIKGTGAGIRLRDQDQRVEGFRLTSDATRAALAFDITQPGVRVEPDDTSTARADRCRVDLRIDKQPGDGILAVGNTIELDWSNCDIYECKGFGVRGDNGTQTGITRTNVHYVGLWNCKDARIGYCGGHAVALHGPNATSPAFRCTLKQIDTFGNGINTSIMYASADGNYYTHWIFGENCEIRDSAPDGRQGTGLTVEILGGVHIAGRYNRLINNRYIETKQPIYWANVSGYSSIGLTVDTVRVSNATLTHTNLVSVEGATPTGLRIFFDNYQSFTNATNCAGSFLVFYRGQIFGTALQTIGALHCAYGGTANAITLTYGVPALTAGVSVSFYATSANTGATTINLDGLGAVACVTVTGAALPSGYIRTGVATQARYDGTNWVVDRQIERGSNANGEYTRFADGTQECWHTVTTALVMTAGYFGGFRSSGQSWTFPVAFSAAPIMSAYASAASAFGVISHSTITTTTGAYAFTAVTTTAAADDRTAHLRATGRWY